MDDNNYTCNACGSDRVVGGKLVVLGSTGYGPGAAFVLNEMKKQPLKRFLMLAPPAGVPIRREHQSATLCLDCGTVNASLTVDVKQAEKVVEKWATDALKRRIGAGDELV